MLTARSSRPHIISHVKAELHERPPRHSGVKEKCKRPKHPSKLSKKHDRLPGEGGAAVSWYVDHRGVNIKLLNSDRLMQKRNGSQWGSNPRSSDPSSSNPPYATIWAMSLSCLKELSSRT